MAEAKVIDFKKKQPVLGVVTEDENQPAPVVAEVQKEKVESKEE